MREPKPALVVLAAGASRRLGEPKALVRIHEQPPHTPLERLLTAGRCLDEVPPLVVTGAHHDEIAAALPAGCEVLHNPRWEAGRTGGLRLAAVERRGRDLCVAPVDCPLVPASVFELLSAVWRRSLTPERGWLAPAFLSGKERRFGHPVVFGRGLAADLEEFSDDTPLTELRARARPLFWLDVAHEEVLDDLDTPADLARLKRM